MPSFFIYPEKIVQEGVNSCKKSLLGKIILEKNIHVSALKQGLASIWGEPAGLTIHEIEGNILQFFMDNTCIDTIPLYLSFYVWIVRKDQNGLGTN